MSRHLLNNPRPSPAAAAHRARPTCPRAILTLCAMLLMVLVLPSPATGQVVPELQINSQQYIVIDADTGEVFAQRGAGERAAMASLTKVFTAVQAIDEAPPDYLITIHESDMPDPRASFMGFSPGETYTLDELLHGLMLPSGNDAAHAIARSLGTENEDDPPGQAVARFVGRINQRLKDMGLENTHLVNPDGWGVPGHYTTVHDLAAFIRHALQYPRFVALISAASYTLHDGRVIYNNNRMLNWYEDLIGGKTGYDDDAGWCLIEVAERDGNTMISVTFDGIWPDDWYDDNRALLEYAFTKKTERLMSSAEITGDIVSFKDPDAAVISRTAISGASLGQAASVQGGLAAAATGNGETEGAGSNPAGASIGETMSGVIGSGESSANRGAAFAVLGVVALILVARALGSFSHPVRRPAIRDEPEPRRTRHARRQAIEANSE